MKKKTWEKMLKAYLEPPQTYMTELFPEMAL